MATKKKYGRGISKEFEAWHKSILEHAHAAVMAHGYKAAPPTPLEESITTRVIMKRAARLEELIHFFYRDEGFPYLRVPFLADDAAALILWPKWKAVRLARTLLPKIPRDMVEEWLEKINMDWLNYELEV